MSSTISFGDANAGFQAGIIHGPFEFHIQPELENSLGRLPHAKNAPFNSYVKQHEPSCLPDTRVGLLDEIHGWAEGQNERCVFWLRGLAGTGKSTIARTVARRYYNRQRLAASFFFSRGGGDVGHAAKFVTSIAFQLAHSVPASYQYICTAVAEHGDIASQSLRNQWHHLVLHPLSKLHEAGPYVVVVDALDECDNDANVQIIIQLLAEARLLQRVQLRVFLTSRPEVPIRQGFYQIPSTEHQDFILHNISPSIVDHDIKLFLEYQLKMIAKGCYLPDNWPGEEDIRRLVQSASGLFIWAATACRFVQEGGQFVADRLRAILEDSSFADNSPKDSLSSDDSCTDNDFEILPTKRLDSIYLTVLKSPARKYRKPERKRWYTLMRETLGAIVLLQSPLAASHLAQLLFVPAEDVHRTLHELHSILDIPQDLSRPVRLHHPSFRDFLLDRKRCGDDSLWVNKISTHKKLASCCLKLMSAPSGLRQNMCSLLGPGVVRSEIDEGMINSILPPELQYACRYWVEHLERSPHSIEDGDATHHFLKKHFLHWLEAMSLINGASLCVQLVARLQSLVAPSSSLITSFLSDANQFILRFVPILAEAPLQIYSSGLLFSPEASIVRTMFIRQVPQAVEVLSGRDREWDACRSVLEGHSDWVRAVVFSPDGQLVASASVDSTVRVWETATGQCRSVLEGHSAGVSAVVFSPDGQLVASASGDRTVRVWETATGQCRSMLEGHSAWVRAVVFSPDGQLVASASVDGTVRVWETATGQCRSVLEGHSAWVNAVVFSPDGQLVASASEDGTVRVWETATGQCRSVLEGHSAVVNAVVFSPDGQLVASASEDSTVRVWETATGQCSSMLEGHSAWVNAVVFSPDGQLVASVSGDSTVRVWETATGQCRSVLPGYFSISHIAFSPDGQRIQTNIGEISLSSGLTTDSPIQHAKELSSVLVRNEWIVYQKRRFLWLPPEYRHCKMAVHKHLVCLGCESGRVTLLRLQ